MDCHKILETIRDDFIHEGLDCMIQSGKDAGTKLLVYSGTDLEKRTQIIEMRIQENKVSGLTPEQSSYEYFNFQFDVCFPFKVDDYSMSDVAQFLHFLNLQVEVPGFYLNYIDNTLLYRYVHLAEKEHIAKKIITSIIGMAMLFQDVFGQTLERLATGKVSFVDLMKEISTILDRISKETEPA